MADILLIEPDMKLGIIYCQYLQANGHNIRWRNSAQSALSSIDKRRPNLVILEIQLANHNGIEFLYELRSYQDWQNIPVIVHSQVPPIFKTISPMLYNQLGVVSYCYKPTTKLQDLLIAIEDQLIKV